MNGPGYTQDASRQGRVVVTSAGTPGIGAELVRAVAAHGAKVALRGTRPDGGQPLIDELRAAGHAAPRQADCDVRDERHA